jgi:hypothetical protein
MSILKTRQCDICGKICNEKDREFNFFSQNVNLSIPKANNCIYDEDENFIYPDVCQDCRAGLVSAIVKYIDSQIIKDK